MYDLVVIGSGPGGYVCAIRAAQLGLKVAIIERYKTLGGTCLNVGCIPSKALLRSSEHFWMADKHFAEHGIETKELKVNLKKMLDRKRNVVSQITGGVDFLMKKNKIERFEGHGSIVDKNTVAVGDQKLEAKNIVIATGSKPNALPGVAFDKKRIISSTEALELEEIPKHLLVVGAGVIGLEMGSVWARLGAKVSVIEYGSVPIPGNDKMVQKQLQKSLEEIGMEFIYNTAVKSAQVKGSSVELGASDKDGKDVKFSGDYCLVAIGRRPYTESLGLENIGLELDSRGFVPVNEHLQTKQSNVYAIGDVIGGMMLAHKAEEEGICVAETIANGRGHVNYDAIPNVIYTFPEVATVGKTEEQLKQDGIPFKTGKFAMAANGRAVAMGEGVGFIKVIAHKDTDRILGVHMICPQASELIAEAGLAMEYYASSEDIGITCHAHPTLSESFKEAALSALKRALHGA
tara:strand:- start:2690 stop:4072 length:1383 start_codon:yes stop_codon:yes gene_type:complete